jgi:hypothetical protein
MWGYFMKGWGSNIRSSWGHDFLQFLCEVVGTLQKAMLILLILLGFLSESWGCYFNCWYSNGGITGIMLRWYGSMAFLEFFCNGGMIGQKKILKVMVTEGYYTVTYTTLA